MTTLYSTADRGAFVDPAAGTCVLAKAGHLPPMLTLANGHTSVIDLPLGLPIGLGAGAYEAAKISLPAGATLALWRTSSNTTAARSAESCAACPRRTPGVA